MLTTKLFNKFIWIFSIIALFASCERTKVIQYNFDEVDSCVIFVNGYVESSGEEVNIPTDIEKDTVVHGIPINRDYYTISRIFIGQTTQLNELGFRNLLLNIDATITRNSDKPMPLYFERANKAYELVHRNDYFMPGDTVTLRVIPKDPKSELKPISAVTIIPARATATPSNAKWDNYMVNVDMTFDYDNRTTLSTPPALSINMLSAKHNGNGYHNYRRFWTDNSWHTNCLIFGNYNDGYNQNGKHYPQIALYRTNNPAEWPQTCSFELIDDSNSLKSSDNFTISLSCNTYSEEYYQSLLYNKTIYNENMYNPFVNATSSYTSIKDGAGVFYSMTHGEHLKHNVNNGEQHK